MTREQFAFGTKPQGRFLVIYPRYLDAMIYRPGREITVVGVFLKVKKLPLDEIEYPYPFLKAKKIHLWKQRPEEIRVYHEISPLLYWYPYCCGCCW